MAGKTFDELEVGMTITHELRRTLTEFDNVLFSSLTLNTQPLHLDAEFAALTEFGKPIINGIFTMGLVVGITVSDLTAGTIIANLGYENVKHPKPMYAGDTLHVETEIVAKRHSRTRPDAGIVTMRHVGRNQRGEITIEVTRSVLFLKERLSS